METVSLEVKLPAELLALLRKSRREMEQDAQIWIALQLFRQRKVSASKAAELAGLSVADFMDITRQHGIEWVAYTEEELEAGALTPLHVREIGEPTFQTRLDEGPVNGWDFFSMAPPEAAMRPETKLYALPSRSIKGMLRHLYAIASDSVSPSPESRPLVQPGPSRSCCLPIRANEPTDRERPSCGSLSSCKIARITGFFWSLSCQRWRKLPLLLPPHWAVSTACGADLTFTRCMPPGGRVGNRWSVKDA